MAQVATTPAGAVPSTQALEAEVAGSASLSTVQQKYEQERAKRLRADGAKQFVDFYALERLERFNNDPWVDENSPPPADGDRTEILILGAGYGGLLYAVRLLEAGFELEDIRFADSASGFGGTWYWNRYPGLKCDIESYIYMPLLEETGYMPTEKYCTGLELQEHAERIAKKWNLTDRAWFQRTVNKMEWDEGAKEWVTHYTRRGLDGKDSPPKTMRSRFVVLTTGFTLIPRAPQIPGIGDFKGEMFHTARWDYKCTGGSPTDPNMTKLKDKCVGIIGTGATSIQVVPALANSVKTLYVFQRTPSAVDTRGNHETDVEWWQREHSKPGWQKARRDNFNAFLANVNPKPSVDLVGDGWTTMPSYSVLVGNPEAADLVKRDVSAVPAYVAKLHALDLSRQEKIRKRVEETVKNPIVAEQLKPWYPGWCKRPCFHDEYLEAFNKPNVTLVDTDGQGVELITENGIAFNGREYKIDILILGTGYRSPFNYSPGGRVNIDIIGRNSASLDKKWVNAVTTLHGMMSHDFPNICWPGLSQSGGTPNFTHCMDLSAQHISEILHNAVLKTKQSGGDPSGYKYNFIVEPTADAEEEWSNAVASQAGVFAAAAGCTPSYINAEGDLDKEVSEEVKQKRARGALWGKGFEDFSRLLSEWRSKGDFSGLEIKAAS
ncbi:FAD/NAD(P)-binding domain-containing protein [Lepidopterella palustris CBS 459.81]|uniref:FAD/NAD(P)-binding domain-containing protein n=1 Tax=Lepidopterella palustris CBS 459.81 TaxID=1314670 RepID=A0A8E2E2Y8_9PEZI|nr:FAD/NAD(P)-binding domain-containing protein [Lepidopterella palustris CBS 459.81]